MKKIFALIKTMRPRQWFKSFYLLFGAAPAVFLLPSNLFAVSLLVLLGIINLILVQGAAYIINDIADVGDDRKHPKKKFRSIASGALSITEAKVFAAVLLSIALLLAYYLDFRILLIDIILFANNILYSLKPVRFKDKKYFDIFTAGLNFPLRVMVGWHLFEPYNQARFSLDYNLISTSVPHETIQSLFFNAPPRIIEFSMKFSTVTLSFVSIMILTYFLAVFLLSLKRLAEKHDSKIGKLRSVLKSYSYAQLNAISIMSAFLSMLSLFLLAWSLKPLLIIILPFILYLLRWYYRMTFVKDSLVKEPEQIFTKSPKFIFLTVLILILSGIILFL